MVTIKEIQKIGLDKGDVLVVKFEDKTYPPKARQIMIDTWKEKLKEAFPDNTILLTSNDVEFVKISKESVVN